VVLGIIGLWSSSAARRPFPSSYILLAMGITKSNKKLIMIILNFREKTMVILNLSTSIEGLLPNLFELDVS
jgi:hypothetical protein